MAAVEFIPPGRAKLLWGKLITPNLGLMLLLSLRSWHIGFEFWATGAAINIGPLSLGWGATRTPQVDRDRSREDPISSTITTPTDQGGKG